MNPMTSIPAKYYTKSVNGKPNPPKNKAVVGSVNVSHLMAIDPSSTPVKAYTKKQP